jgi:hypothetical protein
MDAQMVRAVMDEKEHPAVDQCYIIPSLFRVKDASPHDKAIYSMWNHVCKISLIIISSLN